MIKILRRINKFLVIRPLVIIMTLLVIDDNPALCHITQETTRSAAQELIRNLSENDLIRLANQLGINREDFIAQVFRENIENIENHDNSQNTTGFEAIGLFILGTVALFIIARYGHTILEFRFKVGTPLLI
jgi:hypothetical protein